MLFISKRAWLLLMLLVAAGTAQAQQAGRISGSVVEARSGQPLAGVTVVVVGTLYATVTDGAGHFILGAVPPGGYTVEVNALGFQPQRRAVTLAAGAEEDLAFHLRPPEVAIERVEAAALERLLQPVEGMDEQRLRQVNAHESGELLRALTGTDAARRGAVDFEPVVRGLWGNQIGVFVDGARLLAGSPYGFSTPMGLFDPHALARVEVVKGPHALTWGAGTLSAIRVTTRGAAPAGTRLRSAFQAGYTSRLNAVDAAGSLAGAPGKVSYQMLGAYRTGGDYADGSGQPIPAGFQAAALRGQAAYRFRPSTRLVFQAGYQDRSNLDAPASILANGAAEAADGAVRFQTAWAVGPIRTLEATVHWNRRAQSLAYPTVPIEGGQRTVVDAEQTQVGGRLAVRLVPIKGWTLEVGGDAYRDLHDAVRRVEGVSPLPPEGVMLRDARVTDAGLFASGTRAFGRVEATGTLRLDATRAQAALSPTLLGLAAGAVTETTFSGAFSLTVALTPVWQASAGIGSVARPADAYERYADAAPWRRDASIVVTGNPALKPERSTQADFWLRAAYPRLELRLNAFARRLHDAITPTPVTGPGAGTPPDLRYVNGKTTFYGVEADARFALLGEFVTIHGGASYLRGIDDALDEPAFGVAPASVRAGGRLTAPANLFFLEGMLQGIFEQSRVAASRGEQPTDGYVTAALRLGVSLPRSVSLLLGVDNLTGTTYANHLNTGRALSQARLTEPGRVFFIRLRYGR